MPPERARESVRILLQHVHDGDPAVRERVLAALDAQIDAAARGLRAGLATADGGDPELMRRMDELARAHAAALGPALRELVRDGRHDPAQLERLRGLLPAQ
jgi:hypothetical protein